MGPDLEQPVVTATMFAMLPMAMLAGLGFDTNGRFIGDTGGATHVCLAGEQSVALCSPRHRGGRPLLPTRTAWAATSDSTALASSTARTRGTTTWARCTCPRPALSTTATEAAPVPTATTASSNLRNDSPAVGESRVGSKGTCAAGACHAMCKLVCDFPRPRSRCLGKGAGNLRARTNVDVN